MIKIKLSKGRNTWQNTGIQICLHTKINTDLHVWLPSFLDQIFIVLMRKLDISSGLVSPVSVLLRPTGVVCIIILNYADLSPICLERNCCTVGGHLSPGVRDHHEGGDHSELGEQTIPPHHSANQSSPSGHRGHRWRQYRQRYQCLSPHRNVIEVYPSTHSSSWYREFSIWLSMNHNFLFNLFNLFHNSVILTTVEI